MTKNKKKKTILFHFFIAVFTSLIYTTCSKNNGCYLSDSRCEVKFSQFDTQKYRGGYDNDSDDDYQHLNNFKVFVYSTLDSKVMQNRVV